MRLTRAVAMLLMLGLLQSAQGAITVVVNDQRLPSTPPAVQVNNRVLLPMRMVFEALGAAVTWETATQTAVAVRESVTVRLTINSVRAQINERIVILDVPPMLINNSTYVPVRFPAEAFGAEVSWDNATQTVYVRLGAGPPPPTPPPAQGGSVTGVLSALQGGQLVLALTEGLKSFTPVASTIILRNDKQVALTGLQAGDLVEVQYDAQGNPTLIRASYETLEGKIVAKSPNQLILDSRPDALVVDPTVIVTRAGTSTRLTYAELKQGDQVTVRLTPGTNRVYGIAVRTAPPPPPAVGPTITAFTHNATRPLHAGEVLQVTLTGTAGGTAWFQILGLEQNLALPEAQAGVYRVDYSVPAGLAVSGVPLIGNLRVGNRNAVPVESAEPVTLESIAPKLVIYGPPVGETIYNRLPDLSVECSDEGGSGIAWNRCTVSLRGPGGPLAVGATRVGRVLSLSFAPLPAGAITLAVDAYDRAGNHTHQERQFTVVTSPPPPNRLWVSHNGVGRVLMPGDQLVVTAAGPVGGTATFSLGDWIKNRSLPESKTLPGTYRATFTVPALTVDRQLVVSAALVAAGGGQWAGAASQPVVFSPRRELLPALTLPIAGSHVGQETRIEGMTEPYAEVICGLTWKAELPGVGPQTGRLAQLRLYADQTGRFAAGPVRLYGPPDVPVTYTLTVVADQGGRQSEAVVVEFMR